ncbi:DUF721 domain-containing protein [Salidesulfovibrio onnuriiensis]|uniref:DUF721 domain-containing protein n=1 Tax=Salidesulfovibrio onnuriiensis TaxID=2583823 RepID=UPI0011CB8DDC|nr:DUF721 domain-containing protein [Salidesulfovibrio onnuriiensis]
MGYRRHYNKKGRANRLSRLGRVLPGMLEKLDTDNNLKLVRLWRAWDGLMGDMADMARPLGHRGRKLILAAEDPIVVQEASYLAPLILETVNNFFGEEVFDKVLFELLNGRVPLGRQRATARREPPLKYKKPSALGALNDTLDPDSAIGRCYRAYQKIFEEE